MRRASRPVRRVRARAKRPRTPVGPLLAPLVLVVAGLIANHNTFESPFIFDDEPRILNNPAIRDLGSPARVLGGTTRPLVQLTLAVNYAISGLEVWSYHLVNLAFHIMAGLVLFGIVRRTLAATGIPERVRHAAGGLALAAAALWIVHPLQTESVTYVIQRAESLAGLFYLLTVYGVIRGAASARPGPWYMASVVCCALGLASKPVVATAPLMVLIYDRMFLSGSLRQLWNERRALHLELFATLGLLPLLFLNGLHEWRTSAGLGVSGVTPLAYAMTEPGVILEYLRLCLWPRPLCLDYGWPIATDPAAIVIPALAVAALAALSVVAACRGNRLGFLGLWFFLILAPTSSFIPVADPAFEHRLYLPLAAVVVLGVLGAHAAIRFLADRLQWRPTVARGVAAGTAALAAGLLVMLTIDRNRTYQSRTAIWSDTVAKRPENSRARTNLGLTLIGEERIDEGLAQLREVLRRDPKHALAHLGLGYSMTLLDRADEAFPHLRDAIRLDPDLGEAHYLLGALLLRRGELNEAHARLLEAVRLEPERSATHYYLGTVLERRGRWDEAIRSYSEAVRLKPDLAEAHASLGLALARVGRLDEARRELEVALRLQPSLEAARQGLEELERRATP